MAITIHINVYDSRVDNIQCFLYFSIIISSNKTICGQVQSLDSLWYSSTYWDGMTIPYVHSGEGREHMNYSCQCGNETEENDLMFIK